MLEVKGLAKSFGDKRVLEDISFSIKPGLVLGIYGKSGIGKSTIAKILCGLIRPDKGEATFKGELLFSPATPYNRKLGLGIQMVYQQPYAALDPRQRIYDVLAELIKYHHLADSKEKTDELIVSMLEKVNLSESILSHHPHQISGGEAQRVALARSLLLKPSVLIMDEATSMLDVMVQANVMALVKESILNQGGSVMLISHDKALVGHLSDSILTLGQD